MLGSENACQVLGTGVRLPNPSADRSLTNYILTIH